jgi:hypothetical protein
MTVDQAERLRDLENALWGMFFLGALLTVLRTPDRS